MGEETIENAQDTIISSSNEVVEAIEQTAQEVTSHHIAPFYLSAEFWVAISFLLVVCLLFRPILKLIKSLLNKRIDNIILRINEANQLKEDAQLLLADYEKKYQNASLEAKAILDQSKKEIEFIKKESLKNLDKEIKIKEKEANDRINNAKESASKEIIGLASSMSIKVAKLTLEENLDLKTQDRLIDDSINNLDKI